MTRPQDRGAPSSKPKEFKKAFARMLGRLTVHRWAVVVIVVFTVVNIAMAAVGPLLFGHATDAIFNGVIGQQLSEYSSKADAVEAFKARGDNTFAQMVSSMNVTPGVGVDFGKVGSILALALGMTLIGSVFSYVQSRLLNRTVFTTMRGLRNEVEAKINRLPLSYIDSAARGDLLSRVTNDVDNLGGVLQQSLYQLMQSILQVLLILGLMFYISPMLSSIALALLIVSGVSAAIVAKRAKPHFAEQWKSTGDVNAHIEEAFTGNELIQAYGRTTEFESRFTDRNERLYQSAFKAQFVAGLVMPIVQFLGSISFVFVAVVGGLRVAAGGLSLGSVQAFIQYSRQFNMPLMQMGQLIGALQSGVASAERLFEVLDEAEISPDPEFDPTYEARGRVEFKEVSFSYDPATPLIEGLSFVAEPGKVVAIVGPTGAGKTTLVNLLMRFYEVDGGSIEVDGIDITTMSRDALRSRIGMVLQDTWLFGGTIADNIRYGNEHASDEDFVAASESAYVDRFVHALPHGYSTVIDEEGLGVSAGEKQLITIARAFLAKPSILILDEATSSVDTRTELLVQEATNALRSERTAFVIAHRLSTIRNADMIIVMEHGKIVEQGTHDELIAAKGAFYRLYQAQFVGASA